VERVTLTGGGPRSLYHIQEACQFLWWQKNHLLQGLAHGATNMGIKKPLKICAAQKITCLGERQ
jgi:hypothetical protein